MHVLVAQSCLTLCNLTDCSPPGFSAHGILQTRILEWIAIPFSRGSSQPRDRTRVSCIAGSFFTMNSLSTFFPISVITEHWAQSLVPEQLLVCSCMPSHWVVSDSLTSYELALLSMEFSRQENWSGLPFPSPGGLSNPGIEPTPPASNALAGGFFPTLPPGKPTIGPCWLSILNTIVCIFQSQTPNLSFPVTFPLW